VAKLAVGPNGSVAIAILGTSVPNPTDRMTGSTLRRSMPRSSRCPVPASPCSARRSRMSQRSPVPTRNYSSRRTGRCSPLRRRVRLRRADLRRLGHVALHLVTARQRAAQPVVAMRCCVAGAPRRSAGCGARALSLSSAQLRACEAPHHGNEGNTRWARKNSLLHCN
jgi:hypothetical protein